MPSASADYSLALVFGGLEAFLLYRFCRAGLTQLMLNIFGEWVGYFMVLFADIVGIMACVTVMSQRFCGASPLMCFALIAAASRLHSDGVCPVTVIDFPPRRKRM